MKKGNLMEVKTTRIVVKREPEERCENCEHSLDCAKAKGKNVLACSVLHAGRITPEEIKGDIFEGWYGRRMLTNGLVVSKDAVCCFFEKKIEKMKVRCNLAKICGNKKCAYWHWRLIPEGRTLRARTFCCSIMYKDPTDMTKEEMAPRSYSKQDKKKK